MDKMERKRKREREREKQEQRMKNEPTRKTNSQGQPY